MKKIALICLLSFSSIAFAQDAALTLVNKSQEGSMHIMFELCEAPPDPYHCKAFEMDLPSAKFGTHYKTLNFPTTGEGTNQYGGTLFIVSVTETDGYDKVIARSKTTPDSKYGVCHAKLNFLNPVLELDDNGTPLVVCRSAQTF